MNPHPHPHPGNPPGLFWKRIRTETMTYEIRYESATDSGTVMIAANTKKSALRQVAARYDASSVPSHWVVGCWSRS